MQSCRINLTLGAIVLFNHKKTSVGFLRLRSEM